jgi:Uncharacterised nucleotidyltransferase
MTVDVVDLTASVAAVGLVGSLTEFPAEPLDEAGWKRLLAQSEHQRVSGLLVAAITSGALPVTNEQLEQAIERHVGAMGACLLLERQLLEISDILDRHSIDHRVLKGSAVAQLDYSDPALRSFADIDLLVPSRQFDDAVRVLLKQGHARLYPEPRPAFDRRFSKGTTFKLATGFELDLHRTFVMGPYGLLVDLDELWSNSADFELGGHVLRTLGAEERLLHACYHAALGDYPPRLMPRRDIVEMVLFGNRDERRLLALAANWGAEVVVAEGIKAAWQHLQIADVTSLSKWAENYQPSQRDRQRLKAYQISGHNYSAKSLAALREIPRWRDRMAFTTALILPQQSYITTRHRGVGSRLWHGLRDVMKTRSQP